MNLTFRQLQTFREVMRTGSISEASRVLGRTQPAVSSMIAGLERELCFALFNREQGRLKPRPEALYLLEEAEAVLSRLTQTGRAMAEIGKLSLGRLRIACHPAAASSFLPNLLADFLQGRDHVEAALMMRSSAIVDDLIASQEYDIGLAETPPRRASVHAQDFALDCPVALHVHSPLADKTVITPRDLCGVPLATLFDEHVTWIKTSRAFERAGATINRRFVLRTFFPALQLARNGLCACICDRITASSFQDKDVVFRPFKPAITSQVSILTPAHRPGSLLGSEFRKMLVTALEEMKPLPD
ncbi:MAG: LysR family transcriptional regulator [Rhodobacteraceae bacterium]|nr:LysR family transcriptional regulator [Paracoccaceae bacterium]